MATNILQPPAKQAASQPSVTSLQEAVETIEIDALQHAHTKCTHPLRAADLAELMQRHDFVDHFKFGLAVRIANMLAAHDEHVQAIYYFDPDLNSDAQTETYAALDATVNLLILVESKLPSPLYASLVSILNAILITEQDVDQGRGYAILLSSMYLKPRQVW
jgi:hypothetical protein